MDKIVIEGLEVNSVIGVYDWEREQAQKLIFDVRLTTDLSRPMQSDNVADTIDYAKVAQLIEELTQKHRPELLERLADLLIKAIFARYPVTEVWLKIVKPDILSQAEKVGVEICRQKNG